jgi:hypothetical protein
MTRGVGWSASPSRTAPSSPIYTITTATAPAVAITMPTSFTFNAKPLDSETGLYFFGALLLTGAPESVNLFEAPVSGIY